MKSDSKRNLVCCLCLYCTWAGLEEPSSWFCLSIYPGKQPNFSLSVIFKDPCADHFRKEHVCSCLLASDHWKKRWERHLNLTVICCPAADRHMLKCTVKHRQYFRPFLGHSSLIILVMLPRGLLRVSRMGTWWNRPWTCFLKDTVELGGISVSEILYRIFLFPVSLLLSVFKQK